MSEPKEQHYVPQCYLREWVDPNTPPGNEPYVWMFDKNGKNKRNKAPKNILKSNDLYTLKIKGRQKDYSIEKTLSNLESEYSKVFNSKIKKKLPLSEEEHITLCAFVSVMLQRTLRNKDNIERFYDEIIAMAESMEKQYRAKPTKSKELKEFKKNIHKIGIVQLLPDTAEILFNMSLAFLCVYHSSSKFVTSDDPCNLFNPDLQWQKFYGPGLGQKNIQVTLPLSPDIMLCLSWSNFRGYIKWKTSRIEEANRMTIGHSYKHFISFSSKTKRLWFCKYPMDLFFIFKLIRHQINIYMQKIKTTYINRHVRKK